jgi:F-type H+-transporting ATPase subunit delta
MAELSTLARPYAKAAFEYAVGASTLEQWSAQLNLLAALVADSKVAALLAQPALTTEYQAEQLIAVCGDELGGEVQNFVRVLAENKRLSLLPHVAALFAEFKANRERSVDVSIDSAFALTATVEKKLAAALSKKLERDVKVSSQVDQSLIGGVVIRAADVVIDASIRGRLDKLAKAMNS